MIGKQVFLALMTGIMTAAAFSGAALAAPPAPQFKLDPLWPKTLANHAQLGPVTGVYGDDRGLIWIVNQSNRLSNTDLALERGDGDCCTKAPQVIAFDKSGAVVKSWNIASGPNSSEGCGPFRCFVEAHGIYVDQKHNVWVVGHGLGDTQVVKFSYDGKFLLQIGGSSERGCCGNQDTVNVEGGTGVAVWPATNEVFVSDGYVNRRIIVFDADTGKFKRMWGAYGHPPPESKLERMTDHHSIPCDCWTMATPEPERTFEGPGPSEWINTHAVAITPDGIVWVADRGGNRIQQFHIDGTFIREAFISRHTKTLLGTAYSFAFSRDPHMNYVYIADGSNKKVHILDRETLTEVGFVGGAGGQLAGQFNRLHVADTDRDGNLYTGEAGTGARVQRWVLIRK